MEFLVISAYESVIVLSFLVLLRVVLSRNRVFNFLGYVQFVLTIMSKSQNRLARGGHGSVQNWTIGSGYRVLLLSRTVSYSYCLPCSDPSCPEEMHVILMYSCNICVAFWAQGL